MAGTSHRWTIYNPETDETLTLPINPLKTLGPPQEKKVDVNSSTQGAPVVFEGRRTPTFLRAEGNLLLESDHAFYQAWYDIPNAVLLTDHLGRKMWVYMTKFIPDFRNRTNRRWSATHQSEFLFIRWDEP